MGRWISRRGAVTGLFAAPALLVLGAHMPVRTLARTRRRFEAVDSEPAGAAFLDFWAAEVGLRRNGAPSLVCETDAALRTRVLHALAARTGRLLAAKDLPTVWRVPPTGPKTT